MFTMMRIATGHNKTEEVGEMSEEPKGINQGQDTTETKTPSAPSAFCWPYIVLSILAIGALLGTYMRLGYIESGIKETQNSLQEINDNISRPNNYPEQNNYLEDGFDQDYFKPLGVLYIMEDGKQYIRYCDDKAFVQWEEEKGTLSSQNSKTLPASRRIKKSMVIRSWEVNRNVIINGGRSPFGVSVSLAGIATPPSIIFIQEMEDKTIAKHPNEFYLGPDFDEKPCLEQWIEDEVMGLVKGAGSKQLSDEQIYQATVKHFQQLCDKYGLGLCCRGMIIADREIGHYFIN